MRRADLVGGIGLLALSLLLVFVIIPAETAEGAYYGLSPLFYPTVMAAGIGVCAVGLIAQALLRPAVYEGQVLELGPRRLGMFLLVSAIVLGGVIAIDVFGIWVGGPLLIGGVMLFMGERQPLRVLATAVLPVAVVHLLFTQVLHSPLP